MDVFDLYAKIHLDTNEYERGLSNASDQTNSFGSKVKSAFGTLAKVGGAALVGATTAVIGFGKSSVEAGMSFDAAMSQVGAISGATGTQFDALREKALEMGSKTKFSATESAEAFNYMAMAGWKTGDMLNGIEGIMNLAAASGEDLATTSDIVTDALTAFGLSASDSGHFADVLAVASSNANTNVGMMGETFKYVAPVAGALGYSIDDTAMAIGLMANSGIKASQAGTSLRSIITRLSTDAGASSKSLGALGILTEKLGVEFYNADGTARGLNDVLVDSRGAWQGLSEEEQITYAKTIAGQEAMSAWLALMNASPGDIGKLTSALKDADGAAQEMAETMEDNLAGDITKFKSALEGAQIILSDQLTPTLRGFVQFGTEAISTLSTAFKDGGLSGAMEALGTILSDGLNMVIDKLPDMIDAGMQLLGALGQGLLDNLNIITDAAAEIIITLVNGIAEALPHLAEGAVQIVTQLATKIGEALPELIPTAVEAVLKFLEGLTNPESISNLLDGAMQLIEGLIEGISKAIPLLIEYAPQIIVNLISGIVKAIPKLLEVGVQLIKGLIEGLIRGIIELPAAIAEVVGALIDGFKSLFGIHSPSTVFAEMGDNLILGLLEGITKTWKVLMQFFELGVKVLTDFLSKAWENIKNAAKVAWDAIAGVFKAAWETIKGVWDKVVEFFSGVWEGIKNVFSVVSEVLGGFFKSAKETIQNAWSTVIDFFSKIWAGIEKVFSVVAEILGGFFSDAWEAIQNAWSTVIDFFSNIWDGIVSAFQGAAEWFGDIFSRAWEAVTNAWSNVSDFFSGIWETITGAFSNAWNVFTEIGGNIVKGLWNGIQSLASWLWDMISGWVSGIWNGILDFFGIASPSKKMAWAGSMLIEGLSGAIETGGSKAVQAMEAMGSDVLRAADFQNVPVSFSPAVDFNSTELGRSLNFSGNNTGNNSSKGIGNTYVTINSPKAVDAVQAAREWKKTTQRMAMAY